MGKWQCTVCGYIYDPKEETRRMEFHLELHLKNYPMTGFALIVGRQKKTLKKSKRYGVDVSLPLNF